MVDYHVIERIASAVDEAREYRPDNPIMSEIEDLWEDLEDARRHAINGQWSIGCERIIYRIAVLTIYYGKPAPWDAMPVNLLLDGTYQAVHQAIGIDAPVDMQRAIETWESIHKRPYYGVVR